ncbi:MAG: glycogen/starch/alpha-glucan phosphorylase [Lachnospiraceae bacterium]|jgi:starch phosphorylase|nr:glycogen/starch/alpha-glucan phosphorylase [Lachnospiraceae bacterium]
MTEFKTEINNYLRMQYGVSAKDADVKQLYHAVSRAAMAIVSDRWHPKMAGKRACYFSAEFLVGRLIYDNLQNLGLLEECKEYLKEAGLAFSVFEEIEDNALGNGGLGRLAACYLDSAATGNIPLDGYGIRYRYGLFRQSFEDGFQKESADDWLRFGDPWSIRREDEKVLISFADQEVYAIPYDTPVIGYGTDTVNTLRLWQAEPLCAFDFSLFNSGDYDGSVSEAVRAREITGVLYPNDNEKPGKILRLKQQYFFSSASLQSLLKSYVKVYGQDFSKFPDAYAIQLNDTHPTVSIPELIRLLTEKYGVTFEVSLEIAKRTFAYTNHTILSEALETWGEELFKGVLPNVWPIILKIQEALLLELTQKGISEEESEGFSILADGKVHMARMAIFATHSTNGVAKLHTEILKNDTLSNWYGLYPQRFNNKTNGVTQRRWLKLCNPELSDFITKRIGDSWVTNLSELEKLVPYVSDEEALKEFADIKLKKKEQLAFYIREKEGVFLRPEAIFDIQVKRLHEYKRQILNAFGILDDYFSIKEGLLNDFTPTAYIFGAKAAPGYKRAKGIIKFINEIAKLIESDPIVKEKIQVLFVSNYDVSYAEKLIPAADFSEQISTAGLEASGTGNMKFMINGAPTIGTLDGANVEIVECAGMDNNYIFGATVQELARIAPQYDPKAIYEENSRVRRVVDTLIDGTLSDGESGTFKDLYLALLDSEYVKRADEYYVLYDLMSYIETRRRANTDKKDTLKFAAKGLMNCAKSGTFSSDRSVSEYAADIWKL